MQLRRLTLFLALTLVATACRRPLTAPTPGPPPPAVDTDALPPLAPLVEPSGTCPAPGASGSVTVTSSEREREVLLLRPPGEREDLPIVFVWHGLGATARSMVPRLNLRGLADRGAIVVVPQARPDAEYGWTREDGVLFEDLRACLVRDGGDPARVVSVGFSAGALWTTILLGARADAFAAVVEMSGGALSPMADYRKPAWPVPALLFDGGTGDVYRKGPLTVRFARQTERLRDRLRADGSFAVHCRHDGGHRIPTASSELIHRWVLGHRYGEASPFAPDDVPGWCWPH